jgi:cell filamentation protein
VSADDPYVYPEAPHILRNRLGIKDEAELDAIERVFVARRIRYGSPFGQFDAAHIKAIHKHLFQDLYEWAGEFRTVELAKGGHQFQLVSYLETGIANIHSRLVQRDFLSGLARSDFAQEVASIIGDLNYVHPFREGNGRTQLQYLKQLARRAGHDVDLTKLKRAAWQEASRAAHQTDYSQMAKQIAAAVVAPKKGSRT